MEKDILQLNGRWEFKEFPETARRMRDLDDGNWMTAAVPASIYTCLIEAGAVNASRLTADPENFRWVNEKSWIFRKTFDMPPALLQKERIQLVFEGLDTVSQIWLNDKLIGKTENMFIPHTVDVTQRLKPSNNILLVKFRPALAHAEQLMQRYGRLSEHHFGDGRRSYIRKAQYQFGSVMGPALAGCGIFRPVYLEGTCTAKIDYLHVRTVDCNQYDADVRIAVAIERTKDTKSSLHGKIHLTGGGLDITQQLTFSPRETRHTTLLHIDRPIRWWPAGYGVQHQYHLKAELYRDNGHLDTAETDFGIRTIRLDRTADDNGTKFRFVVNERPIYIKGANWMPLSMLPGGQPQTDYETILKQAAAAHFNMLRLWGGGFYENPEFYRLCNQLGILLWQDFMFASAYYPDRQWFKNMIETEAAVIIKQLRNHPCLALWCGNSHIDSLHESGRLGTGRKFYGKAIYHELIPSLLSELDPDREYLPTTPWSDLPGTDHQATHSGTTHNWNVWTHYADLSDYEIPKTPRFVTEFGLQSLPELCTISKFASGQIHLPDSFSLEKHNFQPGGQQRMMRYIADNFVPPSDLEQLIRQSQLTQARAVKRHVEHLRSHNAVNSGCLIWTFNEPAACIGFSMMDAFQNPKALYYYAKRFFAPVLVTLASNGRSTAPYIVVINDSPHRITATLDCRAMDFAGENRDRTRIPVTLSPFSRSTRYPVPKSVMRSLEPRTTFLFLSLYNEDKIIAENTCFLAPDKYLQLPAGDVELEITSKDAHTWQVNLSADTVIRDLQLIPPYRASLSDNFITLLPGRLAAINIRYETKPPFPYTPVKILAENQNLLL